MTLSGVSIFLRIHEQLNVKSHLRSRPRLRILEVSIEYQFDQRCINNPPCHTDLSFDWRLSVINTKDQAEFWIRDEIVFNVVQLLKFKGCLCQSHNTPSWNEVCLFVCNYCSNQLFISLTAHIFALQFSVRRLLSNVVTYAFDVKNFPACVFL